MSRVSLREASPATLNPNGVDSAGGSLMNEIRE